MKMDCFAKMQKGYLKAARRWGKLQCFCPTCRGVKERYYVGDLVNVTCYSRGSSPPASILWKVNDIQVKIVFIASRSTCPFMKNSPKMGQNIKVAFVYKQYSVSHFQIENLNSTKSFRNMLNILINLDFSMSRPPMCLQKCFGYTTLTKNDILSLQRILSV